MAWLSVDQSLPDHRKTLRAADILSVSPVQIVGHMVCFWLWALDNAPDGDLGDVTPGMIARAAQWDGDPQLFTDALSEARFLESEGDPRIRNWEEYGGKLIEGKRKSRERAKRSEERRKAKEQETEIPEGSTRNLRADDAQTAEQKRKEKIREEKNKTLNPYVGQNPPDALEEGEDSTKNDEVTPESAKIPHVPHTKIMDLWNSIVAPKGKPSIKSMTDFRKKALKRMWRDLGEGNDFTDPDVWRQFFEFCTRSEVLMAGGWFTFDWLFKPANFQKIFEGNYHGRRAQAWQERR